MSHLNSKSTTWENKSITHEKGLPIKKRKTIQEEFIEHCAIAIQSTFRGFRERKKYRAFLPIYRRVRELLYGIYCGWKTRRILKLQPIKIQISEIKLKMKNGQASSARIAKRQLINDIERLTKKGRWIEVLMKTRINRTQRLPLDGKENSSLYCNVKSKSIKNVFKRDEVSKKMERNNNIKTGRSKEETMTAKNQFMNEESMHIKSTNIDIFDERPLKMHQNISICETESQMIQIVNKKNVEKHQYLKKRTKNDNQGQDIKNTMRNLEKTKNINAKQMKVETQQVQSNELIDTRLPSVENSKRNLQQSQISKSSQVSKKKIQITLADPLKASVRTNQSHSNYIDQSTMDMKIMQSSTTSLPFSKAKELVPEIMSVYSEKYMKEKYKIAGKLKEMSMKYTQSLSKSYEHLLLKF